MCEAESRQRQQKMALMHAKADLNSFSFLSRVPGEFGNNCGNIQSNNSQHFSVQPLRRRNAVPQPWKILRFSAKLHRQTLKNVPSTRIPWDGFADSCTNCEVVHWSERLRGNLHANDAQSVMNYLHSAAMPNNTCTCWIYSSFPLITSSALPTLPAFGWQKIVKRL